MLRGLRLVVFSLLPVAVLALGAELVLAALGLGDGAVFTRGFDPEARYLVPDPGQPGGWRTQMFDGTDEVSVPPRDGRLRVLLFGGSNTQMFPAEHLQAVLDRSLGRPTEVINLGRQGYGSERVAILALQALALRPDVVVVYAGHNEFIEQGYLTELRARLGELPDLFKSLRVVSVLAEQAAQRRRVEALREAGDGDAVPTDAPEPWVVAYGELGQLSFEDTLERYAQYGDNLARICDEAHAAGAEVVLCTPVSNMLAPPFQGGPPPGMSAEDAKSINALAMRGTKMLPDWLRAGFEPPLRVRPLNWRPPSRDRWGVSDTADAAAPKPVLRSMLGALAPTPATTGHNSTSVEGAHWPHPALWNDRVHALIACVQRLHAGPVIGEARMRLEIARDELHAVLADGASVPRLWFLEGLLNLVLGDGERAAERFAAAGAGDRAPRRTSDTSHARVRAVASARPFVQLLDADALFRARCPDGIVGYEVMMDHCHVQPGARLVLMEDIARSIVGALGR